MKPSEVRIVVIANLMLSPPDAYVLKHARVKYTVELLRHNSLKGKMGDIPDPFIEIVFIWLKWNFVGLLSKSIK